MLARQQSNADKRMLRLRDEPAAGDLSSTKSDSGSKRQKLNGKIDIADRVSSSPVRTDVWH